MSGPLTAPPGFLVLARHIPLVLLSPEGAVAAVTEAAERALGCRAADMLGHHWPELCDDPESATQDYLHQCARSLHPIPGAFQRQIDGVAVRFRCEGHATTPDWEERRIVLRIRRQDRHDAFVLLAQKVEELNREIVRRQDSEKQVAEALAREREAQIQLRTVLDEMPAGVMIAEAPTGRVVYSNRQSKVIFARDITALDLNQPASFLKAWHADGRPYEPDEYPLRRALRGEMVTGQEVHLERADGQRVVIHANAAPIHDASGRVLSVVTAYYDITQEKHLERVAEAARIDAETASRAKDDFLAMLGHELRNPLAPIVTALELMELNGVGGEKERSIIERQVEHVVRLVDDLLDLSRVTHSRIELALEQLEVGVAVTRAVEMVSPLLEKQRVQLEVAVPAEGLGVVADPARLAQVVSNLLNNAVKYSEHGGRVWISAHREDDDIVLAVRDEGVGITPDLLPKIFDLFVQERQSLDRSRGGLGIGLAIVRGIVDLHGGTIAVRSAGKGEGAEFTIRLPFSAGPGAETAPIRKMPARSPTGARILVVDDNEDGAEALCQVLRALGHVTEVAHDGLEGLRIAREFLPDLALLDIGLPAIDGYELALRLRAEPALRDLLLVAVTGYGQNSDRLRSQSAGFDAHLVKPVSITKLEPLLGELLSRQGGKASAAE